MFEQHTTAHPAHKFLAQMFEPEGEPLAEGHRVTLWNSRSHQSQHHDDLGAAVRTAQSPQWENLTFFGVCTRGRRNLALKSKATGRDLTAIQGGESELAGMPGIWLDLDVDGPGHKKANLCPSVETALGVVADAVPLPPTVTVRTGGGIHCYWLFAEGVVEFGEGERSHQRMFELCASFQRMVEESLNAKGWSHDNTSPLPRVMRLPGFKNVKHGGLGVRTSWETTGRRYSIDELWQVVPDNLDLKGGSPVAKQKLASVDDALVVFDVDSTYDEEELREFIADVCSIDEDFERVWNRRRRDLPGQSEHDQSIANRLISVGTPAARVVQVLQFHRLSNPKGADQPEKVKRADYYDRTIRKALAETAGDRKMQRVVEAAVEVGKKQTVALAAKEAELGRELTTEEQREVKRESGATGDQRAMALAAINEAVPLPPGRTLVRISRAHHPDPQRELLYFTFSGVLGARQVPMSRLQTSQAFCSVVASATGVLPQPMTMKAGKPRQWGPVFQAICMAAEEMVTQDSSVALAETMGDFVAHALRRETVWHAPRSESWVKRLRDSSPDVMLYRRQGGALSVVVRYASFREHAALSDALVGSSDIERRNAMLGLNRSPGIKRSTEMRIALPNKGGSVAGYMRVDLEFLECCGTPGVADLLRSAFAEAKEDDE